MAFAAWQSSEKVYFHTSVLLTNGFFKSGFESYRERLSYVRWKLARNVALSIVGFHSFLRRQPTCADCQHDVFRYPQKGPWLSPRLFPLSTINPGIHQRGKFLVSRLTNFFSNKYARKATISRENYAVNYPCTRSTCAHVRIFT